MDPFYFPIAKIFLDPWLLVGLGFTGGFASGMLGVSGGVIITPGLIFFGIPPLTAVSSQLTNAIGTNLIGFLGYWRHRDVDFGLATYLFIGGIAGAAGEFYLLNFIHKQGSGYAKMTIAFTVVLTFLGLIMLIQSLRNFSKQQEKNVPKSILMRHWMIYLPLHRIFKRSRTEISVLIPLLVGFLTGLLTSTLGGGNNLVMMPIIAYLIGRATPVVTGTTLLAAFAITVAVSLAHAFQSSPFDMGLVFFLLLGSTVGSQLGVRIGYQLPRPLVGLIASFVVLGISSKFIFDMVAGKTPAQPEPADVSHYTYGVFEKIYVYFANEATFIHAIAGIASVVIFSIVIEQIINRFAPLKRRQPLPLEKS